MIKQFIQQIPTILLIALLFGTATCSDNDDPITPEVIPATSEISFSKTGGSETLSIKSNITLVVESNDASWCHVTPATSASGSVYKYTVTVDANNDTSDRSTTITVKGGNITKTIQVVQIAADGLIVTPTTFKDIAGGGGDIEVTLTTNGEVTVTCNVDWITEVTSRAAMSKQTRTFHIASNFNAPPREGSITFSLGNLTETVTVSQLTGTLPDIGMNSDAMTLAGKIYAGLNIGNTLESIGGETEWGNPRITEAYIKKVKSLGFNAIRIPCAWDQYIKEETGGPNKDHQIQESWLNRVNEVVGYCVANDMYAIVNIHWDGGWLEDNCTPDKQEENNKKQHDLWTQIAQKLNHYDEHLLFAGTNEPKVENAQEMAVLKSYLQTFVDAVRATKGNNAVRNLIVQGPQTDIDKTEQLFGSMPTDIVLNRLMVEVHYYDPWTFCGLEKDEAWGKMAYFWGAHAVSGSDRNATYGSETEMKAKFAKMKAQFVDKGIPVILGEYGAFVVRSGLGVHQEAHNKSRSLYDETVTREAKNHGLIPFYWEIGQVFNRNNGEIKDHHAIDGVLKGAKEGKYPF